MQNISGAKLFVNALVKEGVDKIFAYPGAVVADLFDEIYKQHDIELILPRHEQGLVHAADGYARSTGKVGVCLVTSGPGATNLVTGIATANTATRVPLLCITIIIANTNIIGALKHILIVIWNACWTFWTSVVNRVIKDDVENESIFLNEKSWIWKNKSCLKFFANPQEAFEPL